MRNGAATVIERVLQARLRKFLGSPARFLKTQGGPGAVGDERHGFTAILERVLPHGGVGPPDGVPPYGDATCSAR